MVLFTMGYLSVSRAVTVRLLFASHGLVSIWRLSDVKDNPKYWYLAGTLLLLILESLITLVKRQGKEWQWFCPSVFIYLLTSVPAIWMLELHEFDRRMFYHDRYKQQPLPIEEDLSATVGTIMGLRFEVRIPIKLTPDQWIRMLEQLLLLILILGRWLLPKGKLTHDQLSQLLLVYIGTAADIVEFFEAFKEKEVRYHKALCVIILGIWSLSHVQYLFFLILFIWVIKPYVMGTHLNRLNETIQVRYHKALCVIILGIWSLSLVQFSLVLTASRNRKTARLYLFTVDRDESKGCCRSDVYGILITIVLQDLPFLVLRMMLIFKYNVFSYTNMFFTSKNTLVIVLLLYRLVVVFVERHDVTMEYTIPLSQSVDSDLDSFYIPDPSVFQKTEDTKNRFLMATYPQEYHTRAVHSVSRVFSVKYEKHKWGRAYFFEQVGTQIL